MKLQQAQVRKLSDGFDLSEISMLAREIEEPSARSRSQKDSLLITAHFTRLLVSEGCTDLSEDPNFLRRLDSITADPLLDMRVSNLDLLQRLQFRDSVRGNTFQNNRSLQHYHKMMPNLVECLLDRFTSSYRPVVVDLGAGRGRFLEDLFDYFTQVLGMDPPILYGVGMYPPEFSAGRKILASDGDYIFGKFFSHKDIQILPEADFCIDLMGLFGYAAPSESEPLLSTVASKILPNGCLCITHYRGEDQELSPVTLSNGKKLNQEFALTSNRDENGRPDLYLIRKAPVLATMR